MLQIIMFTLHCSTAGANNIGSGGAKGRAAGTEGRVIGKLKQSTSHHIFSYLDEFN